MKGAAGMTPERQAAAERRAEALSTQGGRSQRCQESPRGVGGARSLAFPAQLRAKLEKRNGQELYHLNGIASVTDTPYEMWDMFGPYEEIVEHSAFDDTLAAEPDVAFLVNHRGVTMARTTNGTLDLGMVDEGLGSDAWLNPKRQDVSDLVVAVDDKNITEMSFAFMLEEGWWSDDFSTFKISKVDINRGDVSAVNYGANPYTSIAARSREILADLEHLPAGAARAALDRLSLRTDLPASHGGVARAGGQTRAASPASTGRSVALISTLLLSDEE
jgi:HK97 family phage prohead protease